MKRSILLTWLALAALVGAALAQTTDAPNAPATVIVRLPSEAKLVVGSQTTPQRGSERRFVTPELAPGYTYSYRIEARWMENGEEVVVVRTVDLHPGKTHVVDFFSKEKLTMPKRATQPKDKAPIAKADPDAKAAPANVTDRPPPKSRTFLFTYSGVAKDLKPGQAAKVWLPVAETTPLQKVEIASIDVPAKHQTNEEKQYGNRVLFFEAKADAKGEVPFKIAYKVTRQEVRTDLKAGATLKPREDSRLVARFLQADAKVPVAGKPLDLLRENLKDKALPGDQFAAAKVLYDVVNNHMKYSKEGKGWGQGDAVWACDSKFGNCTDFHSLFISMARGNKIPSKFEMGFPIPPKRGEGPVGGYHCWAWFIPEGKGWIPVDISEANRFPEMRDYYFGNLTEDRVQFTTGRDLELVPRQDGPPLNFLIYPYVEVGGQPYPAEKVSRTFAYKDVR